MNAAQRVENTAGAAAGTVGGQSLVYAVSSLLGQLGTLLTFPLYTRVLGVEGFGVLALMLSASGIVRTIVISGTNTSLMRLRISAGPRDASRITTAACLWAGAMSLFLGIAAALFSQELATIFAVTLSRSLVAAVMVFVGLDAAYEMVLATARAEGRPTAYAASNLVRVLVTFSAAFAVLVIGGAGVEGAIYSMALGSFIGAVTLSRSLSFRPVFRGSLAKIPDLVRGGAPLVPANLASWVSNLSDRYLLLLLGSTASVVGLYSAGYRLGSLITTLFVGPFHTAFLPLMLRYRSEGVDDTAYRESSRAFLVFGAVVVCGLQAVAVPAVIALAGSDFAGADRVVSVVAFGCLLMGAAMLMTPSALTAGRPHLLSLAFGAGAVANVGSNLVMIPLLGMVGAGISTLIGYAVVLAVMLRLIPDELRPPELNRTLAKVIPIICFVTLPSTMPLGGSLMQWVVSALFSFAGVIALVASGVLNATDLRMVTIALGGGMRTFADRYVPRQGPVGPRIRFVARALSRLPHAVGLLADVWRRRSNANLGCTSGGRPTTPYLDHLLRHPEYLSCATQDAERILAGDMITFGREWCWRGGKDWHLDPISGRRWALVPSGLIDVNRVVRDSDVQCVWETSRLDHVWRVALRYFETGDERYARWAVDSLTSWCRWNPVGWGINWTVTMEIALRAVAIAEIRAALRGSDHWNKQVERRICRLLSDHVGWTLDNLEHRGECTQNHYLAALASLLVVAVHLPEWETLQAEVPFVYRCFVEAVETQVTADGVDFENSVGYHLLVCELVGHAVAACTALGIPVEPLVVDRLGGMIRFARVMEFGDGSPVAFGDDDDDFLAPSAAPYFVNRRPSLEGRLGLAAELVGGYSDASLAPPISFDEAGVYVLGDAGCRVFVNVMSTGVCGSGPHRHNDALSFCLEIAGSPVLVDPGTYRYQCSGDARDRYRSTAAHNTVQIDGEEQNSFVGPFSLVEDRIQMRHRRVSMSADIQFVEASHEGFVRGSGVVHVRSWTYCVNARLLTVVDTFQDIASHPSKDHTFVARFHLAPGSHADVANHDGVIRVTVSDCVLNCVVGRGVDVKARMVASTHSPYYRHEVEAAVIEIAWRGPASSTLTTTMRLHGGIDR